MKQEFGIFGILHPNEQVKKWMREWMRKRKRKKHEKRKRKEKGNGESIWTSEKWERARWGW